ncbi:MAG: TATA-box-binding protein [Candidatus Thorarchaeota archaeon]
MKDIKDFYELNESDGEVNYKINNIVATVNINLTGKIDLIKVARKFKDAEYFPERFPGLILRQENPRATFLIFSTGKMVITGLKVIENAQVAVAILFKKMKKIGIKLPEPQIIIQNIVANGNLHTLLNLNKAVILLEYAMYEPEIFPGLIYNMKDPRAVFLLFSTGKFVCTGIKDKNVIEEAISKLQQIINKLEITSEKFIEFEEEELIFL